MTAAPVALPPPDFMHRWEAPLGLISAMYEAPVWAEQSVRAAIEAAVLADRQTVLNTPEIEDFALGVRLEAMHQRERWGDAHDRSKSAENWYWVVGYLAGKALRASIQGDREKALHHTISAAACLAHWHQAIKEDLSGVGIGLDLDLKAKP